MKNKNIVFLICMIFALFLSQSCLKLGLDEVPNSPDAEIKNFYFEYRWEDTDLGELKVFQMQTANEIGDAEIICDITVPPAQGVFSTEIRNNVALNNLIGYCNISSGATIMLMGDSPKLGEIGDFSSKNVTYKVIAANGTEKTWTINIRNFVKVGK